MKSFAAFFALLLLCCVAFAQDSPATLKLPYGTPIPAELSKSLSSRKSKVGDKVEARVTDDVKVEGKKVIPRNSKLLGEITGIGLADPSKAEHTRIRVLFTQLEIKGGPTVSLPLVLQKIEATNDEGYQPTLGGPRTASGGGDAAYSALGQAETNKELLKDQEKMNATGGKVVGFPNLILAIPTKDVKEGSTFITSDKDLDIPGSTKLLLFCVQKEQKQ